MAPVLYGLGNSTLTKFVKLSQAINPAIFKFGVILMQDILEICCGLDVHRDTVVACLLKGTLDGTPSKEIRTFSTLLPELEKLKLWLEEEQCHHVAMESTGVYWQPIYTTLESAFEGTMVIIVANARHMKNVPGKKTDIKDA